MEGPSPPCKKGNVGKATDGIAAAHGPKAAALCDSNVRVCIGTAVKPERENTGQIPIFSVYKGQET